MSRLTPTIPAPDYDILGLEKLPIEGDGFLMFDPKVVYWNKKGECPNCRDGTRPEVQPGGGFECPKCKWRNGEQ